MPRSLLKNFDVRRLRILLSIFFAALAIPTAALIWQAYSQLKWEAFYQYRGLAEELANRIDAELIEQINVAEAYAFGDYAFLVVSGDPAANFLQRSPLSAYPVAAEFPGVIGYFQVDSEGAFSTPLLPPPGAAADQFGITPGELRERGALADRIGSILADNRLVRGRPASGRRDPAAIEEREPTPAVVAGEDMPQPIGGSAGRNADESELPEAREYEELAVRQLTGEKDGYSQQVFDRLNSAASASPAAGTSRSDSSADDADSQQNSYAKVADLKLDATLEKKTELQGGKSAADDVESLKETRKASSPGRSRRSEQSALPESIRPSEPGLASDASGSVVSGPGTSRITSFASEIDPYEFSLLDGGHLVMFRKVWRNDERLIQGLLIDTTDFIDDAIAKEFGVTSLATMSDLIIGYEDDVIEVIRGGRASQYPVSSDELQGTLLYRNRLSAPLDRLSLIFSINRLPPGPGATVLLWTSVIIGIVFIAGFAVLYRLALGQLQLARQQQDFVSAVSHELKTPLTSIRMYGEMLKAGWVSEEKRKQYYDYIHDESERLSRLISNVLQLAKITRNEPKYELKPRIVAELMDEIQSKIGDQIERSGFSLNIIRDPECDKSTVRIDEDCFAQIVINLVDNAIKFSRNADKRAIDIGCTLSSAGKITFSVRDYGPGIAKDQMKKIFQLFYRSESELTRETVGTGIGLAIVHQLAIAMKGKVDVVNRDPGAEFRVEFPSVLQ
ncbi:MAG: HAMP domain-containing histidine kinase [Gammaproteobacteria bacterium]|nr:HAMP domain-containing histidine kinase [Gammaproteobacteria bacterium]MDH4313314.1 HAMP domain-containing histidine kinase [Gammaproteobacteria bacterium]MDH5214685.1 HAMP domain-containing histidine kinase [Gammaproteobacteria bacterium]MDH5501051.1 HAMP domain-containing histidine kinase [Gammaproteobacteria bacterium]